MSNQVFDEILNKRLQTKEGCFKAVDYMLSYLLDVVARPPEQLSPEMFQRCLKTAKAFNGYINEENHNPRKRAGGSGAPNSEAVEK